jgi:hypothetical protein
MGLKAINHNQNQTEKLLPRKIPPSSSRLTGWVLFSLGVLSTFIGVGLWKSIPEGRG